MTNIIYHWHWHRMNGNIGCIPDSIETYETEEDAIEAALVIFNDLTEEEEQLMLLDLKQTGLHYFEDAPGMGADYCQVEPCTEPDCLEDLDY